MKPFESTGFWCLPEQPETLVAGTLHVSGSGDLRLSLIGELTGAAGDAPGKRHRVIHGSVSESPSGNAVTLHGCVLSGASFGSHHGKREEYRAGRAYFGDYLTNEEDFAFRHVSLKVGGLSEWADSISGVLKGKTRLPNLRDVGTLVPVASYLVPNVPSGKIKDAEVRLRLTVGSHSTANMLNFREEANILFDFNEAKSIHEIDTRFVYPIQNLMTFASDRAQNVEAVTVWRGEDFADWQQNPEIRVIGPRVQPDEESVKAVRSDEMLLTLADVDFAPFIDKWLRVSERYAEVLNIYFGIQYAPAAYVDLTYSIVAQSLCLYFDRTEEGMKQRAEEERRLRQVIRALPGPDAEWLIGHLGVNPRPSFSSILHQLLTKHANAIDPLIAQRREAFVNHSATTLRFLENRDEEERLAAAKGSDLFWLTQQQRFLFKACLLSELGFGQDRVGSLLKRDPYFRHIANLEAIKAGTEPTEKEVELSFQFIVPSDEVLATARRMAQSTSEDEQSVGKCLLDLTEVVLKSKAALENPGTEEHFDLSVIFDYNAGGSLEFAKRLTGSADRDVHNVATTLEAQLNAIAASKIAFLGVAKGRR